MSQKDLKRIETSKIKSKTKIPVTFNSEQIKLLEDLEGILGNTKAEIIRNIVINWILSNRGSSNEKK